MNVLEFLTAANAERVTGRAWVMITAAERLLVAENLNGAMVLTPEGEAMRVELMGKMEPEVRSKRKRRGALDADATAKPVPPPSGGLAQIDDFEFDDGPPTAETA